MHGAALAVAEAGFGNRFAETGPLEWVVAGVLAVAETLAVVGAVGVVVAAVAVAVLPVPVPVPELAPAVPVVLAGAGAVVVADVAVVAAVAAVVAAAAAAVAVGTWVALIDGVAAHVAYIEPAGPANVWAWGV